MGLIKKLSEMAFKKEHPNGEVFNLDEIKKELASRIPFAKKETKSEPSTRTFLGKTANVIDEDGESHPLPESAEISDDSHCFVCDSEYYHLWIGCFLLNKESEDYKKPIYFKKIRDLNSQNCCHLCWNQVTSHKDEDEIFGVDWNKIDL